MGRLIDGTIQALPMSNYILERKETFIKVLENGDNDFLFAMLMDYFDKQPTAYDVEEVCEELEKWSAEVQVVSEFNGRIHRVKVVNAERAINIAREGGVE